MKAHTSNVPFIYYYSSAVRRGSVQENTTSVYFTLKKKTCMSESFSFFFTPNDELHVDITLAAT